MAVTVTTLAIDLRLHTDPDNPPTEPLAGTLERALEAAKAIIKERCGPGAPTRLKDAAITAVASYLYDKPTAPQGERFSNAWRNSGAAAMLAPWIPLRAVAIGGDDVAVSEA